MAHHPLKFTIDAAGNAVPSGPGPHGANMSVTPGGKLPWQAYWQTTSLACDVILPANVWDVIPDAGTHTKTISLGANQRSPVFTLLPNAPQGEQAYTISFRSAVGQTHPTVVVNP